MRLRQTKGGLTVSSACPNIHLLQLIYPEDLQQSLAFQKCHHWLGSNLEKLSLMLR